MIRIKKNKFVRLIDEAKDGYKKIRKKFDDRGE